MATEGFGCSVLSAFTIAQTYDIHQPMQWLNHSVVSVVLEKAKVDRSTRKKIFWGLLFILILSCGGYWLKCRLGINFFDSISISSILPFSYLDNEILENAGPGIVLYEDFDHPRLFSQLSNSALKHNRKADRQLIEGGAEDHSRCLQISSTGAGRWSYPFLKKIQASKGDIFYFEGLVNLEQGSTVAGLCVASIDMNREVIDWDLAVQRITISGNWIKVQEQFTIPDSRIRYISFRLTGGAGIYRFDNLILKKLN